jgi:uncharacterized protein (DUF2336 family)
MSSDDQIEAGLAMVAAVSPDLLIESEGTVDRLPRRDAQILRQVTELFLSNVDRLRESQVGALDGILVPLIGRIEATALVHLSEALSTIDRAPCETIHKLAFHHDPLVAAPVLKNSKYLSEGELLEIAKTRGRQHLLAICGRETLNEALTDTLMRLGDVSVSNALARNSGAKFSECGYATLVGRAERDEGLAEKLGLRLDIPSNLLRELLARATDIVRARFLTASRPVVKENVQGSGSRLPEHTGVTRPRTSDYTQAQSDVLALNRSGKLNDSTVNRFAVRGEYIHVVAALSLLTDVKTEAIEPLIESDRLYGLIVACKAARLNWSTTRMIINNRPDCPPATQREYDQGQAVFETLLLSVSQWTIRFGADRIAAKAI